jgi:hypothetical protein
MKLKQWQLQLLLMAFTSVTRGITWLTSITAAATTLMDMMRVIGAETLPIIAATTATTV